MNSEHRLCVWLCASIYYTIYTEMLVLMVLGLKLLPQACTPTESVSPSHLSGCQIFATRRVTELEAVIAPGHFIHVLSLCVLSNCQGNRESCNWIPFCSTWEGKFTINIIPPPLSPFPPFLLPPSQRGQPGGATGSGPGVLLPWQLICR